MAVTKLSAWVWAAVLMWGLSPLWAQAQEVEGPDVEYKILAELTESTGPAAERTVLSATGRMGVRPEGETLLGAAGSAPVVEYGFQFGVNAFQHDAWRNLVVSAQSGCWVRSGPPPAEDEPDTRPEVSVKGNGVYALRTGARLKLLEVTLAQPAGPARVVRLYVTATPDQAE
jgi:hypothetical protein